MSSDPDLLVLERYVAGQGTPQERELVERWAAGNPERQAQVASMRLVWAHAATPSEQYDSHLGWKRVGPEIVAASRVRGRVGSRFELLTPPRSWFSSAWSWGAGAMVVVLGLLLATHWKGQGLRVAREFATPRGGHATVVLRDGTRIVLAPETHLRLSEDSREAALVGEAYFSVIHDARHPFAVHAGGQTMRDVGTTFDVRAYPNDEGPRVVVVEGQVALGPLQLRANDMAARRNGVIAMTHGVDAHAMADWISGTLTFDNTPVGEVLTELARWYNVSIDAPGSTLAHRPFTGTLANESVESALQIVGAAVGARVEHTASHYALIPFPVLRGHS